MTSSDKKWLVRTVGHVSGLPPAGEQYWTDPTPTVRNLISGGHLEVLAKPVTEPEPTAKPVDEPTAKPSSEPPSKPEQTEPASGEPTPEPEPSPKRRKGRSGPGDEE